MYKSPKSPSIEMFQSRVYVSVGSLLYVRVQGKLKQMRLNSGKEAVTVTEKNMASLSTHEFELEESKLPNSCTYNVPVGSQDSLHTYARRSRMLDVFIRIIARH